MAGLSLKNVTKRYPNHTLAVKDFNLEAEDKEFIVLTGPSGCGKSTVLQMIAGLEQITSGDLYINGERMNDVDPKEREVAMVFQNYVLYPDMTVYENMAFALRMMKLSKEEIDSRIRETADLLQMNDLLDKNSDELTKEERKHAGIARALVRKPKILLMDEPLKQFGEASQENVRQAMHSLYETLNITAIYATQNIKDAMELGTKIVIMQDGEIQQIGTPDELRNAPENEFVAEFIKREN